MKHWNFCYYRKTFYDNMYLQNQGSLYDGCPKTRCPMSDVALGLNEFQNLRLFKELGEVNRDIDLLGGQFNQEKKRELAHDLEQWEEFQRIENFFFLVAFLVILHWVLWFAKQSEDIPLVS